MKKSGFIFLVVLSLNVLGLCLSLAGCSSSPKRALNDDERELVGEWKCVETEESDAGKIHSTEIMVLDADGNFRSTATISLDINSWDSPMKSEKSYYVRGKQLENAVTGEVKVVGQWSLEGEYIVLNPDPDKCDVTFSKTWRTHVAKLTGKMPSDMDSNIDDVIATMEQSKGEVLDMLQSEDKMKILSHTDNTLRVKDRDGDISEYSRN